MPSLDEFRALLDSNADDAFKQYSLLIDCDALDFKPGVQGHDEFKVVKVGFEYVDSNGSNVILMRPDANGKEASYLPWKNAHEGGVSRATLDGTGPAYFSTSQLDGCRFSIQYHDTDRKAVTVQHLAGDYGGPGKQGSLLRDGLEAQGVQNLPATATPELRRRMSIGSGPGKMGKAGAALRIERADTTYYDGGKAAVFGYRTKSGAWNFYGAETNDRTGAGMGLKNLVTQQSVVGSLKANSTT